ncbi:MAG: DUF5106 domain-containing protein [Bacteroidales bacterium]|jgi:thiol-disulfide isomerase/thioredoxin|nr:DUF5106 domain-containing protein [Bacteroidales bacterium]
MKKICFTILISLISIISYSQDYEIKVKVNGLSDTIIYLGYYMGNTTLSMDTAKVDKKGNAVFKNNKPMPKGVYVLALPSENMVFIEFLIGDSKKFSMETDVSGFYTNMKIKGSRDNELFMEYKVKMEEFEKQYTNFIKQYETTEEGSEEREKIKNELQSLNQKRNEYMKSMIIKAPDSFFTKVLNALIEIEVPDLPKDEEGNTDPVLRYLYVKDHYFDRIDFSEGGLVRTPIYQNILDYYLNYMVAPAPDSLIKETHDIINRTYEGGDTLMFQYTLSRLFNMYDTSRLMGYDAVFVAIAEDWYLSGKATWADSSFLAKISERVDKITPNKIGNIAPNLTRMQSIDDKYYSLHQIPGDYTVIIFWEPDCGHCKKEVPKLMQELRDTLHKLNVSVFAVYTQYNKEEWEKFIEEKNINENGWYNVWDGPYPHSKFRDLYDIYSTPVVFVLDKDKKIIGKRMGVENIKNLIDLQKKKEEFEKEHK